MRLFLLLFGAVYTSTGIAFLLTTLPALFGVIRNAILFARKDPKPCAACGERHLHTWLEAAFMILDVTARSIFVGVLWPYAIYKALREIG